MVDDLPTRWWSAAWRSVAEDWLRTTLSRQGIEVFSVDQPRVRFWSTQLRAETSSGVVWFKENAPSQAFEAGLVEVVADLAPRHVDVPLATDRDRGWLVTRDLGQTIGAAGEVGVEDYAAVLREWGVVQRQLETAGDQVIGAGVTWFRESEAAEWAVAVADECAALSLGDARRINSAERALVADGVFRIAAAAAELEASGIPDSLQHNDLHPWNAFRMPSGELTFIDLGDALWCHPWATARNPLWGMRIRLELARDAPALRRVEDAYLELWTDVAPLRELRRLLPAAERLSCLHRAASWRRLQADVPVEAIDIEYRRVVGDWLLDAVAPEPFDNRDP